MLATHGHHIVPPPALYCGNDVLIRAVAFKHNNRHHRHEEEAILRCFYYINCEYGDRCY